MPNGNEEKEKIKRFKLEFKSNPLLRKHNLRIIDLNVYKTLLTMGALLLLILGVFVGCIFYLGINDKLGSTYENIINPLFNASVDVSNTYDFKPVTNNKYNFNPNYTIINQIDLEGCNCS